jgi:hypothetical protein
MTNTQTPNKQLWVIKGLLGMASFAMWLLSFRFIRRWVTGRIDVKRGVKIVEGKIVD